MGMNREHNPLAGMQRSRSMVESAQQAMVPTAPVTPGTLQVAGIVVTPIGLQHAGPVAEDAWRTFMLRLKPVVSGMAWIVGDWCNLADREITKAEWGSTYAEMAELTGLEEATLKQYAYVARSIAPAIRQFKLTFAHHQLLAGRPAGDQKAWLEWAVQSDTVPTVAELRALLNPKQPTDETPVDQFHRKLLSLRKKFKPTDAGQRRQYAALLRQMADEIERGE